MLNGDDARSSTLAEGSRSPGGEGRGVDPRLARGWCARSDIERRGGLGMGEKASGLSRIKCAHREGSGGR